MEMKLTIILIFGSALLLFIGHVSSFELIRTAHIRDPLREHAVVYDGYDSIYVIGGYNGSHGGSYLHMDQILKYSLSSDKLETVSAKYPYPVVSASAIASGEDIIIFGGHGERFDDNITCFTPRTNTFTAITNFSRNVFDSATVVNEADGIAYIFGRTSGFGNDTIYKYDIATQTAVEIRKYPTATGHSAAWDPVGKVAYTFGGVANPSDPSSTLKIHKFDPTTSEYTAERIWFPYDVRESCAVWAHGAAYIIHDQKLLRFDPKDNTSSRVEALRVKNWSGAMRDVECTYVPALDRIYIVGRHGDFHGFMYIPLYGSASTAARGAGLVTLLLTAASLITFKWL